MARVGEMIEEGAEIIDIGGESTRPGSEPVEAHEEMRRVIPVIQAIREKYDIPLSLDTYHVETAKAGLEAGVDMINDVSGLKDPAMGKVIAEHGAAVCLMHNQKGCEYQDLIPEVSNALFEAAQRAISAGIAPEKIVLDPGIGFGKTREQNLQVLARLQTFAELGYPMLLGASRKSVIGLTLGLPENERVEGTLATTAEAVAAGYLFVRVHDVEANVRMIRMLETIRAFRR